MSALPPKADIDGWMSAAMSGSGLLPCKVTPEPHFTGRKSLIVPVSDSRLELAVVLNRACEAEINSR